MLDRLRESAMEEDDGDAEDFFGMLEDENDEDADDGDHEDVGRSTPLLGLTPFQRMILAIFLCLNVTVLGLLCNLTAGNISP